jgi:hypothetical protein
MGMSMVIVMRISGPRSCGTTDLWDGQVEMEMIDENGAGE